MEFDSVEHSGQKHQYESGAKREVKAGKGRFDLISPIALRRLAKHFENGAVTYGDRNWEQGLPMHTFIDAAFRHLGKYLEGHRGSGASEDHLSASFWNLSCAIHTEEMIDRGLLPASLMDLPNYVSPKKGVTNKELSELMACTLPKFKGVPIAFVKNLGPPPLPVVYLCGPMTGNPIDAAWRRGVTETFARAGVRTLSPMRGIQVGDVTDQGITYKNQEVPLDHAERDQADIDQADVLFVYFPYTPLRQSIGSLMEMGMAVGKKKPIVLVTNDPVMREHVFTRKFCIIRPNLREATSLVITHLNMKRTNHGSRRETIHTSQQ